jgi:hypothetical protein
VASVGLFPPSPISLTTISHTILVLGKQSPAIRDPAVRLMISCDLTAMSTVPLLKYSSLMKQISFDEFSSAINHTMMSNLSCWDSNIIACSWGTISSRPLRKTSCHLRSKTRFNWFLFSVRFCFKINYCSSKVGSRYSFCSVWSVNSWDCLIKQRDEVVMLTKWQSYGFAAGKQYH